MSCLYRFSLCKLLPYWVRGLFQCDSDYSHTSHIETFLPEGEVRLDISEPSYTTSTRPPSSDSNSSIIYLPTPPPCVHAPEYTLQRHNIGAIDHQIARQMPFSYNKTPASEPTTELGGGDFRWSDFFLDNSKWLMQQYLCFLLTIDK